jgi:hypothetical protein
MVLSCHPGIVIDRHFLGLPSGGPLSSALSLRKTILSFRNDIFVQHINPAIFSRFSWPFQLTLQMTDYPVLLSLPRRDSSTMARAIDGESSTEVTHSVRQLLHLSFVPFIHCQACLVFPRWPVWYNSFHRMKLPRPQRPGNWVEETFQRVVLQRKMWSPGKPEIFWTKLVVDLTVKANTSQIWSTTISWINSTNHSN